MSLWTRIRNVISPDTHQREIREELDFHLEMERLNGRDHRQARLHLGNAPGIAEEMRAAGIAGWLESILQDVRYGLRQMVHAPALTAAVVLSLAIGLGANTAIFTLADAALLKPLPVHDPENLVLLEWRIAGQPAFAQRIGGPRMARWVLF